MVRGPVVSRHRRGPVLERTSRGKEAPIGTRQLDIEGLFSSPALHATLAVFFDYPDDTFYPRLISRVTGTDIKSVLREVGKLEEIGILHAGPGDRGRHDRLNTDFPLYGELSAIFAKTRKSRRYRQAASAFLDLFS